MCPAINLKNKFIKLSYFLIHKSWHNIAYFFRGLRQFLVEITFGNIFGKKFSLKTKEIFDLLLFLKMFLFFDMIHDLKKNFFLYVFSIFNLASKFIPVFPSIFFLFLKLDSIYFSCLFLFLLPFFCSFYFVFLFLN